MGSPIIGVLLHRHWRVDNLWPWGTIKDGSLELCPIRCIVVLTKIYGQVLLVVGKTDVVLRGRTVKVFLVHGTKVSRSVPLELLLTKMNVRVALSSPLPFPPWRDRPPNIALVLLPSTVTWEGTLGLEPAMVDDEDVVYFVGSEQDGGNTEGANVIRWVHKLCGPLTL